MQVIILSAGRGERLRPLTDNTPKPLLKVGGKPLIFRHVENLKKCGFADIVINVSYLGEQIKEALGDGADFGVRIAYSEESPVLETAGGIRQAMARGLLPEDAPFLVVNADIICDVNFAAITLPAAADCHLLLTENPPSNPSGDFSLNAEGVLCPPDTDSRTYTGIGVYHPRMFVTLQAGEKAKLLPLLQNAIGRKTATGAIHPGLWRDVGTPESLAAANTLLSV